MKRVFYILFYLIFFMDMGFSKEFQIEQVKTISENFIDKKNNYTIKSIENIQYKNRFITMYLVHLDPNGFIIVSADDRTMPVLGYSYSNSINLDDLPKQLKKILNSYSESIRYITENDIKQDSESRKFLNKYLLDNLNIYDNSREIDPLITANWNQGGGWNNMCPGNSLVGCVAVAMGQVMYYWQHPPQGEGYSQYYDPEYGVISVNFDEFNYNFDNMFDNNPTEDSQLLLYHAGVAVHMDYSPWGSGASVCWDGPSAQYALDNHFGFNDIVTCEVKINYTDEEWEILMKDQLDRGWPVVYRGYSDDAGHAWNIDGYQDNYYHCNWGWGGSANGYFYFDNLNAGGYNFIESQAALLNIIPDNIYPPTALFDFQINDLSAQFNDLSQLVNTDEIVSWEWSFGDGDISIDISPSHTYAEFGNYNVSLTIMNEFGLYSMPHFEDIELLDLFGDINNDYSVNIVDIVQLVSIILSNDINQNFEVCDLNMDLEINILDVIILIQIILD